MPDEMSVTGSSFVLVSYKKCEDSFSSDIEYLMVMYQSF